MRRVTSFSLALLVLMGCSRDNKPSPPTPSPRFDELRAKQKLYCELSKESYLANKFVVGRCDGLLFTSIHGLVCDYVSIDSFESDSEPGRYYRSPTRDCFVDGEPNGSDSTISKDMMLGLMHSLWYHKKDEEIKQVIDYGRNNNWFMGDAGDLKTKVSKTLLSPNLISLLYDMQSELAPEPGELEELLDESKQQVIVNTGYRAHLQVMRIILEGRVRGGINDLKFEALKQQTERVPKNGLFHAAYNHFKDGDQRRAIDIALDTTYFPDDKLPNNHENYCTGYLFQRDEVKNGTINQDWVPCPERAFELHNGTDFLALTWLVFLDS